MRYSVVLLSLWTLLSPPLLRAEVSTTDKTYDYQEQISIQTFDDVKLSGNLVTPWPLKEDQTYPAIVFINSWALGEHEYLAQAIRFAKDGYLVLSYATRGWGKSEGEIDVAGPKDMKDITAVLDWLDAHTPVTPGKIAAAGISYGAGISLMVAGQDERIAAAVAQCGWGNIVGSLYRNQSPNKVWTQLLVSTAQILGHPSQELLINHDRLIHHKEVEKALAWGYERSPIKSIDKINARGAPIYIASNLGDQLFIPEDMLTFYNSLTGPKKLDFNQGVHASAELGGLLGISNYSWDQTKLWLDRWLKDETPFTSEASVSIETTQGHKRETYSSFPPPLKNKASLYLNPGFTRHGGLLSMGQSEDTKVLPIAHSNLDSGADTGIPLLSSVLQAHLGIPITVNMLTLSRTRSIVFASEPLATPRSIRGAPELTMSISSSQTSGQIMAYLLDVDAWQKGDLIAMAPYTFYDQKIGAIQNIAIKLDLAAYDVPAGHRLALVLDTADALYQSPAKGRWTMNVHMGPLYPAHLTF